MSSSRVKHNLTGTLAITCACVAMNVYFSSPSKEDIKFSIALYAVLTGIFGSLLYGKYKNNLFGLFRGSAPSERQTFLEYLTNENEKDKPELKSTARILNP